MTDPFSTAAGAVGVVSLSLQLLGGCIKGFVLLSTAHNLGDDASTIACMLELQEIQLTEWARRAGLLAGDGVLDRGVERTRRPRDSSTVTEFVVEHRTVEEEIRLEARPPGH